MTLAGERAAEMIALDEALNSLAEFDPQRTLPLWQGHGEVDQSPLQHPQFNSSMPKQASAA